MGTIEMKILFNELKSLNNKNAIVEIETLLRGAYFSFFVLHSTFCSS